MTAIWPSTIILWLPAHCYRDDAASLGPKYRWAAKEWGGFGIWATSLACPLGEYEKIEAAMQRGGTSCVKEIAKMWGAIPSPAVDVQLTPREAASIAHSLTQR